MRSPYGFHSTGRDRIFQPAGRRLGPSGLAMLSGIIAVDVLLQVTNPARVMLGLLDETAHLATCALLSSAVALALGRTPRAPFMLAALVGSVLVDVDHVPNDLLDSDVITAGTTRPYTHSLSTVVTLLVTAAVLRRDVGRRAAAGAATGVLLHLWRDLATGGVPLLWPATDHTVTIHQIAYLGTLVLAVGVRLKHDRVSHRRGPTVGGAPQDGS